MGPWLGLDKTVSFNVGVIRYLYGTCFVSLYSLYGSYGFSYQ